MNKLAFILLVMFLFFAACKNKESKKSIIGSWKPVGMILLKATDGGGEILHSKFVFYKNRGFCISSMMGSDTGNYYYNEKENILIIDELDSPPVKFTLRWKKDTMLITNKDGTIKLLQK